MNDEKSFLEGGLLSNYFGRMSFDQSVHQTAEIVYHLFVKSAIGITLIVEWKNSIFGNMNSPVVSIPRLWIHQNMDLKRFPPIPHDKWKRQLQMSQERVDRAIQRLTDTWNVYYKKEKSVNLLECIFVFYMDCEGRYQSQIFRTNEEFIKDPFADIDNKKKFTSQLLSASPKLLKNPNILHELRLSSSSTTFDDIINT